MAKKSTKWIVRVPITVTVCVEVDAPSKKAAVIVANEKAEGVVPFFNGCDTDLDRPPYIGIEGDDNGDQSMWFDSDSIQQCDMFLNNGAIAEAVEEKEEE